ncbi:Putative universal stress protein [Myxococcaceae bacterium]|jgi:nucleotide-binding universal stress UspA family protein|nr:Putative universal stress protein [Myxococcaceae bacterium]
MATRRRIVAATDFSEAGDFAVAQAFGLAAGEGTEVIVVHAVDPPVAPNPLYAHYGPTGAPSAEQEAAMRDAAEQALADRIPASARERGIRVRTEVRSGAALDVLLEIVEETGADLLVVADSGRTKLSRVVLGSVADRIVSLAPCSVLVARRPAKRG